MARKSNTEKRSEADDIPGLSEPDFAAAVEALRSLIDAGETLLYFSRPYSVRFIGDDEHFRREYEKIRGVEGTHEEAAVALTEVRNLLGVIAQNLGQENIDTAVLNFLEQMTFFEFHRGASAPAKKKFRERWNRKLDLVQPLLNDAARQRILRLAGDFGNSLDDLDVDVVAQRFEPRKKRREGTPFLRIRIRYSDDNGPLAFPFVFSPWGPSGVSSIKTFELECDESDIDFLIRRLRMAKERLNDYIGAEVEGS